MNTPTIKPNQKITIEDYQLNDELIIEFWSGELPRRVGVALAKVKEFAKEDLGDTLKHFMQLDDSGETDNLQFNFNEWYHEHFDMETAKRLLIHLFKS